MARKKKLGEKPLETVKDAKRLQLDKDRTEAKQVLELTLSKGWMQFAGPLLDKMIEDTIGGKAPDGTYSSGIVGVDLKKSDYLLGYRMALMDFHNRLVLKAKQFSKIDQEIRDYKPTKPNQESVYRGQPPTVTVTQYGGYTSG